MKENSLGFILNKQLPPAEIVMLAIPILFFINKQAFFLPDCFSISALNKQKVYTKEFDN